MAAAAEKGAVTGLLKPNGHESGTCCKLEKSRGIRHHNVFRGIVGGLGVSLRVSMPDMVVALCPSCLANS